MVRVANRELRLTTHGRQSSMPISHRTVGHEGVSFSQTCYELQSFHALIRFLFSNGRYFGGLWFCGIRVFFFLIHGMVLDYLENYVRLKELLMNWRKCWDVHADSAQGTQLLVSKVVRCLSTLPWGGSSRGVAVPISLIWFVFYIKKVLFCSNRVNNRRGDVIGRYNIFVQTVILILFGGFTSKVLSVGFFPSRS